MTQTKEKRIVLLVRFFTFLLMSGFAKEIKATDEQEIICEDTLWCFVV